MINTEPILNLLRTNSISKFLLLRARNEYVKNLRELLNELGFSKELDWRRLGPIEAYNEETVAAVRSFSQRNRLDADGLVISPFQAITMLERYRIVEGVKLLQRSINNRSLSTDFDLVDSNNFGVKQLVLILDMLNIKEPTLQANLSDYARRKGLNSDGRQLNEPLARALLADISQFFGDDFQPQTYNNGSNNGNGTGNPVDPPYNRPPISQPQPLPAKDIQVVDQGANLLVTDGVQQVQFRKFQPTGVATGGFQLVTNFVNQNQDQLMDLDLTPSALQVIEAVSKNEGRLDAINTYDKGFLSVGVYQWTLGRDDRGGELPALLKKHKATFPSAFNSFFSNFGIDVSDDTNTTYGFLTYNGQPINSPTLKDQFRDPAWAYRFWRAAQDISFQSVEVEHALSRLKNFYWKDNFAVLGSKLNLVITSAYGVALLLDNHVNRPAWVKGCVEQAMVQTNLTNPQYWTDREEQNVLAAYLNIRETYTDGTYAPMSKSRQRADAIYQEVLAGRISDKRGSFQASNTMVRSYDSRSSGDKTVIPPPFYAQQDFPDCVIDRD
jgi:peptidoglycan hydrolase-like protein with peptidoglycan-binding domain